MVAEYPIFGQVISGPNPGWGDIWHTNSLSTEFVVYNAVHFLQTDVVTSSTNFEGCPSFSEILHCCKDFSGSEKLL